MLVPTSTTERFRKRAPGRSAAAGRSRLATALAAAFALLSLSSRADARTPAAANGAPDERESQRTELYRQATKAAAAGNWAEAKDRLRGALALRSSPRVLFSLAQAEEQLGQLASAQADYARARDGAETEGKGDVVQAADLAQRALAPRVPHLRILVAGAEPGSSENGPSATLDDQPISIGGSTALDPGDHRLVVRARGMRPTPLAIKISEGQQIDRVVSLAPVATESTALPASAPGGYSRRSPAAAEPTRRETASGSAAASSPSSGWATAGFVTAGIGVIALGVGTIFGVESLSKHNDAEKACPSSACPTASGASLWHDAVVTGDASNVAFLVGGAAILAGAVFWIAAPKSKDGSPKVGLGAGSIELRATW
jgi:hypothetical protein